MEIKVKSVDAIEEKSSQQIEQELLEKHQDKIEGVITSNEETPKVAIKENTPTEETPKVEEEINTRSSELSEEEVLEFIGNRYGKEIKSLDEFNQTREEAEPLPEDVSQYLKYKKETGRGIKDFYELQKDFDEMTPEKLLRDYLTATEKGLDAEDITDLMEDYSFDEDLDDEKDVKKIKLAKKKIIAKAKDYFAEEQEKYKIPLESRRDEFSENAEELEDYKQYIAEAKTEEEELSRKRDIFLKRTDDVFSEFKGFEFTLDDNKVYFSPGDANELKKIQSNPQNFIDKHKGEDGTIRDAEGYHKSLAMAMNPDKFANFFYEQGKSDATDDVTRKIKNIKMSDRKTPEVTRKDGTQFRAVSSPSSKGLKIRSIKNKN